MLSVNRELDAAEYMLGAPVSEDNVTFSWTEMKKETEAENI